MPALLNVQYQWIVLVMASLGWIFDAFEGQLFVACIKHAIPDLISGLADGDQTYYERLGLAAFLVGGAVGGFVFGAISDRIGRSQLQWHKGLWRTAIIWSSSPADSR